MGLLEKLHDFKEAYKTKRQYKLKAKQQKEYQENASILEDVFDKGFRALMTVIERDKMRINYYTDYTEFCKKRLEELIKDNSAPQTCALDANTIACYDFEINESRDSLREYTKMQEQFRIARNRVLLPDYGLVEKYGPRPLTSYNYEDLLFSDKDLIRKLKRFKEYRTYYGGEYDKLYTKKDQDGFTIRGREVYFLTKSRVENELSEALMQETLEASVLA